MLPGVYNKFLTKEASTSYNRIMPRKCIRRLVKSLLCHVLEIIHLTTYPLNGIDFPNIVIRAFYGTQNKLEDSSMRYFSCIQTISYGVYRIHIASKGGKSSQFTFIQMKFIVIFNVKINSIDYFRSYDILNFP